jgi:hypothetical protein
MESNERIAVLEANLARQLEWISWSDTKSAFIFSLAAAMIGLLAAVSPTDVSLLSTSQAISASFTVAGAAAAFIFLSLATFPRTDGPKGSLVYCGGIAHREIAQFGDEILAVSGESYARDLAAQCHRNAVIACEKFKWVQRAMIALYLAVGPWAVAVWLLYSGPRG